MSCDSDEEGDISEYRYVYMPYDFNTMQLS